MPPLWASLLPIALPLVLIAQAATLDVLRKNEMKVFGDQGFVPYAPDVKPLPVACSSADWYRGHIEHLAPARIVPREKAMIHAAR